MEYGSLSGNGKNALVSENRVVEDIRLPIAFRFENGFLSCEEYRAAAGGEDVPAITTFINKSGTMTVAGRDCWRVTLRTNWHGRLFARLDDNLIKDDPVDVALDYRLGLSAVLGKTSFPLRDIESIRDGSILAFGRPAGEPIDLYIEGYDILAARGEAVVIDDSAGIRITQVAANLQSLAGTPAHSAVPGPGLQSVARLIFGRTAMTVRDLRGMAEGSIIELDRPAIAPCELEISGCISLHAEVVVIDGYFGARVVMKDRGADAAGSGAREATADAGAPERALDEIRRELESVREEIAGIKAQVGRHDAGIGSRDEPGREAFPELTDDELKEKAIGLIHKDTAAAAHVVTGMLERSPARASGFMIVIGSAYASSLLQCITGGHAESLVSAIAGTEAVTGAEGRAALADFLKSHESGEGSRPGGMEYAREVLEKASGSERAVETLDRLALEKNARPFDFIRRADPVHLVNFLQGEHPQAIAMVLAHLDSRAASLVLAGLAAPLAVDVARRMASMDWVSPEVLGEVERVLMRKISMPASTGALPAGGVDSVVEVLNQVDRGTEKIIIEAFEEQDPELAEEIKRRMFAFEDLVLLDDRSIQKVLREVDVQDLVKALKGTSTEVQEKIFRNMSKRATALLREDMDFMGPVRLRDVEESQQKIINIIRRLEESGDIVIARAGEDELVV